ncbi:MAG: type II secretion system protein [bacterium]|nr:type II secretion system protein [bacterium]
MRSAMTLPEAVLSFALIAMVLVAVAAWYEYALDRAKVQQMDALIHALNEAIGLYHESTEHYPPGRGDGAASPALAAMQLTSKPSAHLQAQKSNLLFLADGKLGCVDPWGQPLRYVSSRCEKPAYRRRTEANGGVPFFLSAGPDRRFGDDTPAGMADNICGDDPSQQADEKSPRPGA